MIKPPKTEHSPWRQNYWITSSGCALSEKELMAVCDRPWQCQDQISAMSVVRQVISRIMKP